MKNALIELKILLIEDNPGDERLIREFLQDAFSNRFKLDSAGTLASGLQKISQNNLDAVLLDLSLPDSQGLETFFIVQKHSPTLPIIILTGLDDDASALQAVQQGAQDYLSKNAINGKILNRSIQYAIKRQQMERQLHLQATALQSTANIVFITDQEGFIEWVNPAFTRITGYAPDEVLGKTPRILNSGQHPSDFYEKMWRTIKSDQVWQSEVTNRCKDGKLLTVEQTVTPFSGHHNQITNFVAIQQDITARKQAEAVELRRVRELEALQKVTNFLREAESIEDALQILIDQALSALNLTAGAILLSDPKNDSLHQAVAHGWLKTIDEPPTLPNEGVAGKVFSSGKTYSTDEFALSEEVNPSILNQISGWLGRRLCSDPVL